MSASKADRNLAVYREFARGVVISAIATRHGISRERVRQIVASHMRKHRIGPWSPVVALKYQITFAEHLVDSLERKAHEERPDAMDHVDRSLGADLNGDPRIDLPPDDEMTDRTYE